jgi:DNA-binding transcriptional regulator YiaG
MNKKYKSEASESVHESASALYAIGAISKATMRKFDESCLVTVPDATKHRSKIRSGNTRLKIRTEP